MGWPFAERLSSPAVPPGPGPSSVALTREGACAASRARGCRQHPGDDRALSTSQCALPSCLIPWGGEAGLQSPGEGTPAGQLEELPLLLGPQCLTLQVLGSQ